MTLPRHLLLPRLRNTRNAMKLKSKFTWKRKKFWMLKKLSKPRHSLTSKPRLQLKHKRKLQEMLRKKYLKPKMSKNPQRKMASLLEKRDPLQKRALKRLWLT